jgi:hypothetical protein
MAWSADVAWREGEEVREDAYPKKNGVWRCLTGGGGKRCFRLKIHGGRGRSGDMSWTEGQWGSEVGVGVLVWLISVQRSGGCRRLWSRVRSARLKEKK